MSFRRAVKSGYRRILDYAFLGILILGIVFLLKYFGWNDSTGNAIIVDGDSLVHNDQKVRLYGIDAPELAQKCETANGSSYRCGKQAKRYLRKLIANQPVTCTQIDTDRYYRAVSICKAGKVELNIEMVKAGWAIAYLSHSLNYAKAQAAARQQKRGVWQGRFVEPQEWRAERR